jgi:lipopolysaccharide transport system ATP-binding protein
MSEVALRVQELAKRYRIGAAPTKYRTFRDLIAGTVTAPLVRLRSAIRGGSTILSDDEMWALDGVSFEVQRGEVVGVIGRNGAGKTTLLKLLSRITEPTRGRAEIHGRVASLLEVGTGFHPELTGRENIFLNGAILGMRRAEIEARFDEIVAFAEVERFIDTQVKHYSSGMYLRLAFAVAAHLEPEILLVDEVLAVGDAAFQRKCLGKMSDVAHSGRTVLFVSHNMEAVQRLCPRTVWLDAGRVVADGDTGDVLSAYLAAGAERLVGDYTAPAGAAPEDRAVLAAAEVRGDDGAPRPHLRFGEPFAVAMEWEHREPIQGVSYFLRVYDNRERLLFAANTWHEELALDAAGRHGVVCAVEANALVPGDYSITLGCFVRPRTVVHLVEHALGFQVTEVPFAGGAVHVHDSAVIAPPTRWSRAAEAVAADRR